MAARDIPFSAPMRAKLVEGAKTQTRRVIVEAGVTFGSVVDGRAYDMTGEELPCPYGIVGDHLWVRGQPDILLEVTGVRAEPLGSISGGDAVAEGVDRVGDPIAAYRVIWDGLNEARGFGWSTNPWVWVITFARLQ